MDDAILAPLQGGVMQAMGRVALWVCQAALALMFLAAGAAKFGSPAWPRMFERWGYPDHFYLVVGAAEVAAGLALLVPRLASAASLALIVIMIGAGATHAMHDETRRLPQILVMSVFLLVIAYGRWPQAFWRKTRA
jgi:putative oxidoreductase